METWNSQQVQNYAVTCLSPIQNKGGTNPARLLKRNHEDNGRVRFLGQFKPSDATLEYLTGFTDEESH